MTELAIEARDLVKTYPAKPPVRALNGLSFEVQAGTVFGLLGPNGAGKSTTVKILTTLSRPDSGTASIVGLDVLRKPNAVRHAIGCVSQKHGSDPQATGRENLLLQGRLYGLRGDGVKQRANSLLERFGLDGAANRLVRTYSGGMQRKLDVALGLMHHPKVLFLDEPTTGLDPEARAEMWHEISRLSADEGVTVLLTTHYLEEADHLAERIAIVDAGTIVTEGTPDELKSELRGDAIHVEVENVPDAEKARVIVAGMDGVREVATDHRTVHARVDSGATELPGVLASLAAAGISVASVTVARPSLDDVYLRHTGRSFDTAQEASTQR